MMTRCHQMTGQQRRSGHPEKQWYLMQERRDSRLISPPSCPTDGVHFTLSPRCCKGNLRRLKYGIFLSSCVPDPVQRHSSLHAEVKAPVF